MTGERIGPGSLKLITAHAPTRALHAEIAAVLNRRLRPQDIRHLYDDTFVIYSEEDTASIRDWLAPLLGQGDSLFVVEFERWSGCGEAIDRAWLLRRGH